MRQLLAALFLVMCSIVLMGGCAEKSVESGEPTVTIVHPKNGDVVYEVVEIVADAQDNKGITRVEFYINDANPDSTEAIDVQPPYSYSWNTVSLPDSSTHTIYVKVYDTGGHIAGSKLIVVTVNNALALPSPVVLHAPSNITASSMTLTWVPNVNEDFQSYRLFRSQNEGVTEFSGEMVTIHESSTTSYEILRLAANQRWFFKVYVYDVFGLSAGSNEVEGTTENIAPNIPAGFFQMGDAFNEGDGDERPVHTVYVDAFYMDVYEVTNAQYCVFLNDQGNQTEGGDPWLDIGSSYCLITQSGDQFVPESGYEDHPVSEVTWYGARAYAEWTGGRLPTEAEWEYAARGGLEGKRYPWGDTMGHDDANYYGTGGRDQWNRTSPTGSFSPNGYGLYDMAGNVWEWCNDWYDGGYYSNSPGSNPTGANTGTYRVLRGGSWFVNALHLRCAYRSSFYYSDPLFSVLSIGFRCVRSLP
ncbi:MAG: SUMF1/EgtB/PvdO family nonheme iron enzyme [Candidatus Latescibacterota bacterium]